MAPCGFALAVEGPTAGDGQPIDVHKDNPVVTADRTGWRLHDPQEAKLDRPFAGAPEHCGLHQKRPLRDQYRAVPIILAGIGKCILKSLETMTNTKMSTPPKKKILRKVLLILLVLYHHITLVLSACPFPTAPNFVMSNTFSACWARAASLTSNRKSAMKQHSQSLEYISLPVWSSIP